MAKPVSFSKFTKPAAVEQPERPIPSETSSSEPGELVGRRRRVGRGKTIGVTLRLLPEDWERVREFGISERRSLNEMAIEGLSNLLTEKGLPKLKGNID